MELPILIEPIAGGRMRARLGEPFDVVAEPMMPNARSKTSFGLSKAAFKRERW